MVLFEMKNIKKSFGSLEVLKDISLQVEAVSYTHLDVYKRQIMHWMQASEIR